MQSYRELLPIIYTDMLIYINAGDPISVSV